jgi:hypothetical protein
MNGSSSHGARRAAPQAAPITWSTVKPAAGVADHHLDLPQRLSGQPGDLIGEPVDLGHRLPTAAPHGVRQLLHPPSWGVT